MKKLLGGIILGLLFGFSLSLIFAWTNPSGNPPSGGGVLQTQNTGLFINTSTYFISDVGIGTTAPTAKLDVRGVLSVGPAGAWASEDFIGLEPGGTFSKIIFNNLRFYEGGYGDVVTINDGNVGIGTTSPLASLDVAGNARISGDIYISGSNRWRIHSPDDGRTTLYIAPGGSTGWNWGAQTLFDNNGNVYFSGNVGIGTTNPTVKLDVKGNLYVDPNSLGGASTISLAVGDTDTGLNSAGDGALDLYSNNVNTMSVRPGNVGIGTTNPVVRLDVRGALSVSSADPRASEDFIALQPVGTFGYISFKNLRFYEGGYGDVVTINDGNVGIGTITPGGYKLYVNGYVYALGYQYASDIRLKKEIKELNGTLEKVMNLHPISFIWNEKSENSGKKDIGIAGQEIEKYFPELVFKNNGYISVDYSKLSVVAISAIREQQKIIEEQAQKIKVLEEKVKELEEILRKNEK